jgi:pimeloyl-ACP methyl ester carboxylesterase
MVRNLRLPNGVLLPYMERGNASGVPVILLHGVTDSWRSFEPALACLPPTIRAFALTMRGHGDASRPAGGYGYADMAGDVDAFMDALDVPAAVIVGHSMGALVAQRFAVDHPEKAAGLVLIGSFKTLRGHAGVQEFWDSVVSQLTDPVDPAVIREFQSSTLARPVSPELFETVVSESAKVPAAVWQATFRSFLETEDFSRELAAVRVPVLLVWGDHDRYAPSADQDALCAALGGARLAVYAGAGHAPHWEEPERFAQDLVGFVYERRPAPGG